MTEIGNSSEVYTLNNDSSLLDGLTKAVCVATPNSFLLAGFNDKGRVLSVNRYNTGGRSWNVTSMEPLFQNKSLHRLFKKVTSVFYAYEKYMLVPKALYHKTESEQWMQKLYFPDREELLQSPEMKDDRTRYLFYIPADIKELYERHMDKPKMLPLAAYQFHKNIHTNNALQCCLTGSRAYATLYQNGKLAWHRVFPYKNAEDIAYLLKLALKNYGIEEDKCTTEFSVTDNRLNETIRQLTAYFPALENGTKRVETPDEWTGVIYLLQQLFTCA